MDSFLYQATLFLTAAVIAVPLAARLGLGSVLGYLLAGMALAPVLGLGGAGLEDLRHFAEFGVVMMLFLIGLELEPRNLWAMRHRLLGLGGLQIIASTALIALGAWYLGQPGPQALAIGLIFALSSTAIVLQTLTEKGLMQTTGGRSMFSVLLTQDVAVIPMLAFLPLLAMKTIAVFNADGSIARSTDHAEDHHATLSLVEGLPGWGVTLATISAVAVIILAGTYLIRPIFRFIDGARLREMYTALALLIVVGIALLMVLVGLSPALGTFLAGVVLANSEFRHELESTLQPFKGLLLGLFFITVGAGINFIVLANDFAAILGLTLAVMVIKGAVLFALALIFRIKGRDRWLFTLGLAQAGEFGFVLISFAIQTNVVTGGLGQRLLLMTALSMLLTPLFFILYEILSKRTGEAQDPDPHDDVATEGPVIIAGMGRFGQMVNRMVQSAGFETTVLDHDLRRIQLMRQFGYKGFYGDPTRPNILHAAGLEHARVLVVALDDKKAATALVGQARRERPDLHIVVRAHDRVHVYELYRAGANDIVREMFDSSLRAGRYVLENMGLNDYEAAMIEQNFYAHDRGGLRELAELWKPGVPVEQNPAYLERSQALHSELEAALISALDDGVDPTKVKPPKKDK